MKAEGNGNGVIVPDKLRQFLTNLAALLPGEKSDAKIAEKQIQQLAAAILARSRAIGLAIPFTSFGRSGGERTRFPLQRNDSQHCLGASAQDLSKRSNSSSNSLRSSRLSEKYSISAALIVSGRWRNMFRQGCLKASSASTRL
jgi:hypothetical protein